MDRRSKGGEEEKKIVACQSHQIVPAQIESGAKGRWAT